MLKLNSPGIMISTILVLYIGVGRFRILGGEAGGARFRILGGGVARGGGANSQQAHDVVLTSMRRNKHRRHFDVMCPLVFFL